MRSQSGWPEKQDECLLESNALWPLLDAGFAGQYIAQLSVLSHGNVVLDHAEPPLSITELHGIKYCGGKGDYTL